MWYDFEAAFESKKSEAEEMLHDEDKLLEFISKVLEKLDTIPVVGSLLGDIPLLCMIVVDYVKGEYTEIPLASVIGIIAALIYFFSPVDLIPDCIHRDWVVGPMLQLLELRLRQWIMICNAYREWHKECNYGNKKNKK